MNITILSESNGRSAGEKNAGGATGYQMENGDKKTLEELTIGQKRKRDDGMNNVTIYRYALRFYSS